MVELVCWYTAISYYFTLVSFLYAHTIINLLWYFEIIVISWNIPYLISNYTLWTICLIRSWPLLFSHSLIGQFESLNIIKYHNWLDFWSDRLNSPLIVDLAFLSVWFSWFPQTLCSFLASTKCSKTHPSIWTFFAIETFVGLIASIFGYFFCNAVEKKTLNNAL